MTRHHTRFDRALAALNARVRARTGDDMTTTIPAGWKITAGTDSDGDYIDITPPEGEAHSWRYYDDSSAYMAERLTFRVAAALLDAPQPQEAADAIDTFRAEVAQVREYADALNARCIEDTAEIGRLRAEVDRLTDRCGEEQAAAADGDAKVRALTAEVARLTAERDALVATVHDELAENMRIRELAGATDDENITQVMERVIRERDALRLYARALCKAVDAATDFAGTVAGGASWWDDVWAEHFAALDRARERVSMAATCEGRTADVSLDGSDK